jgi:hypothetical protein
LQFDDRAVHFPHSPNPLPVRLESQQVEKTITCPGTNRVQLLDGLVRE